MTARTALLGALAAIVAAVVVLAWKGYDQPLMMLGLLSLCG